MASLPYPLNQLDNHGRVGIIVFAVFGDVI